MPIDFNELRELLTTIAQTDIAELTLKSDDFELTVRKGMPVMPAMSVAANSGMTVPIPQPTIPVTAPPETVTSTPAPVSPAIDKKWVEIKSPIVGTFYRAPGPDEAPFVEVGDRIRVGQTVCIIEAMKVMNEIEAEVSGQVVEILVQNGQTVEYDQPIMRVNPE